VRVVTGTDEGGAEKLGFEYLDGPVTPKPEKIPERTGLKSKRRPPRRRPPGPRTDEGPQSPRGSVPKVPLKV
jgi:ATP-dependent Clp protease ATP-binding subunit ClpA